MSDQIKYKILSNYFKEKKYVIVDSALSAEQCKLLSDHLLDLVEKNQTEKDSQCPLSESIYGDAILDSILEDLRPVVEKATGLNLYPTYSYARKYLPGDELKPHLDRAACEISATLTLGFDGNVWPIHVSTDDTIENDIGEILMNPGDMVIYRGMEINHWRKPYTQGKWQCQVFLHYVDADGPHKDLKYDGREKLGVKAPVVNEEKNELAMAVWSFGRQPHEKYLYTVTPDFLPWPLIESIINYGQGKLFDAGIGDSVESPVVDKSIRNVSHCWLPFDRFDWLYMLLEQEIKNTNWINFKFNLTHMEMIDYLEYHAGKDEVDADGHGKYSKHVDGSINSNRKLSFSILLSDPSEFEGGDLLIYESSSSLVVPKNRGQITFFPSTCVHEVTPVTKGVRRSIVSWIHGPQFT